MLSIKPSDRVLEIGSGNRPRKRSNILCDKYIDDNSQRSSQESIHIDARPFVLGDGLHLPFRDKSFDYVIASHILEHVDDPFQFTAELMRVAPAGYIETPSELGEKLFGWSFHRWIVRRDGDGLILRPRTAESPFGDYFHRLYDQDALFAECMDSHYSDFYCQYEWKDVIHLRIEEDTSPEVKLNAPGIPFHTRSGWRRMQIRAARFFLWPALKVLRHLRKFDT